MLSRGRLLFCGLRRLYGVALRGAASDGSFVEFLRGPNLHPSTSRGTAAIAGPNVEVNVPAAVQPSEKFVRLKFKRAANRYRLAHLLAEMELAYARFAADELPTSMSDWQWQLYFDIERTEDRIYFLMDVRRQDDSAADIKALNVKLADERLKMMEEGQRRYENGEMVYSRYYNCLMETRGPEFLRKAIDRMYGSRLLGAERVGESLPQLVIDGRFMTELSDYWQVKLICEMQRLYETNWFCRHPFPMSFVNMVFDDHLAVYVKRHLLFLTGPPRLKKDIPGDDVSIIYGLVENASATRASEYFSDVYVNPLNPTVSPYSIRHNLPNVNDDEILYVSYRASEVLEGPITQYKAIVICATNEELATRRSVAAARIDRLDVKRVPANRYIKWGLLPRVLPLRVTANVLRAAYCNGGDWESAVCEHVGAFASAIQPKSDEKITARREKKEKILKFKRELAEMNLRRLDALASRREERYRSQRRIGSLGGGRAPAEGVRHSNHS